MRQDVELDPGGTGRSSLQSTKLAITPRLCSLPLYRNQDRISTGAPSSLDGSWNSEGAGELLKFSSGKIGAQR